VSSILELVTEIISQSSESSSKSGGEAKKILKSVLLEPPSSSLELLSVTDQVPVIVVLPFTATKEPFSLKVKV
jgi:hypothetical protein